MRNYLLTISLLFSAIFQGETFASETYRFDLPSLIGEHCSDKRGFEVTINTGKKFSTVKNARLILKGRAIDGEWLSVEAENKIVSISAQFKVTIATPCKPEFTKFHYPTVAIGPLSGQFEIEGTFKPRTEEVRATDRRLMEEVRKNPSSPELRKKLRQTITHEMDWSFLDEGDILFSFSWEGVRSPWDKQIRPCIVNIEQAYILVDGELQNPSLAPESPSARILFESSKISHVYTELRGDLVRPPLGFFIDQDGRVWKYVVTGCQRLPSYDSKNGNISEEYFREKFRHSKLMGNVDLSILKQKISLIAEASKGTFEKNPSSRSIPTIRENYATTIIGYYAYLYDKGTGTYNQILLEENDRINTAKESKELLEWFKEVIRIE